MIIIASACGLGCVAAVRESCTYDVLLASRDHPRIGALVLCCCLSAVETLYRYNMATDWLGA